MDYLRNGIGSSAHTAFLIVHSANACECAKAVLLQAIHLMQAKVITVPATSEVICSLEHQGALLLHLNISNGAGTVPLLAWPLRLISVGSARFCGVA